MVLPLVEAFLSPQGEGYNAGLLAFFVRFAGCNLDCRFADGSACDTPWQKANFKWTIADLMEWMESEVPGVLNRYHINKPIVILTGGEPTMAVGFDTLVYRLKELDFYVAVESNGTRFRESLVTSVNWLVLSPKHWIRHENPLGSPTPDPRCLALADEMRFVIAGRNSPIPEFNEHADQHYLSPALLADGTGTEWHDENYRPTFAPGAVDRCLEICRFDPRWRISIQSHKFLRLR